MSHHQRWRTRLATVIRRPMLIHMSLPHILTILTLAFMEAITVDTTAAIIVPPTIAVTTAVAGITVVQFHTPATAEGTAAVTTADTPAVVTMAAVTDTDS